MYNKLSDAIRVANQSSTLRKTVAVAGSAATLALMGFTAQVHAQDAATADEIVVTGIRGSLQKSLDVKRNSDSIVDAISAEDVGKFPDKNVAESLQRIPGVTISRPFGEGAGVSIRGSGQDLTLTTLNGQNVASTGWFVFEQARRSFNYELLPSELVGGLEVHKSSQADLAEGGVGGSIVVNTRKPLDMKSMSLYGSIEAASQSDSGEVDPQFSAMGSWKNESETFGALVSLVAQKRSLQRQGNEAFWEWGAGPVAFEQDRERSAQTVTLQFAPSDNLDFVFNAMNMEMAADNTNYALWLTQGNCSWCAVTPAPSDMKNLTVVKGPVGGGYYQARPREATMKSDVYDFTATYTGEGYEAKVQLGTTNASGGTDFEMVINPTGDATVAIPGATFDFSGNKLTWDLKGYDTSKFTTPSLTMGTGASFNSTPKEDGEDYFQGDIKFDVDFGAINSIKTGIKVADHHTVSRQYFFTQEAGFNPTVAMADYVDGTIDVGYGDYSIPKLNIDKLKAWAKASITGKTEDIGSHKEIDETNKAVYVMASFEQDAIHGNLGVRYVTTDASSTYYLGGSKKSDDGNYSEFLPSVNVSYNLSDDVVLRTSAARVMARPQYSYMYQNPSPTGTNDESPNNQFWISGNVNLKPYVADQFDIGLEWYFADKSMLSAALFTKNVKNFVSLTTRHADASEIPFVINTAEQAFGWTVQQYTNAKSAGIEGIELQYQQDFGNGFGALVNYTYTDTDTDKDTFVDMNPILSDSSKNSYNVTGYFENELFQVRLAYNWRSEYMIREEGAYGNRLQDAFGSLDASASWFATENISVKLDVSNLLEDGQMQYGNNKKASPLSGFSQDFPVYQYETARRVNLGVSFKF